MKKLNFNVAEVLGLILLILSFFTPVFETKLNTNLLLRLINSYLIAYIGYMISFMDTKRVLILFIPLIFHSIIILFLMNNFIINFDKSIVENIIKILTSYYDLILLILIFFILEFLINKLIGSFLTNILAAVSFVFYFILVIFEKPESLVVLKDIFLYFAIYVMAIRIRSANKIDGKAYILAIILVLAEIYIRYKFKIDYGFIISIIALTYLLLKSMINVTSKTRLNSMIFSYIYILPSLLIGIKSFYKTDEFAILIIGVLSCFILGDFLGKIKSKYISSILIGLS